VADEAIVVAVDGPSGSGKSSVCRDVARRMGLRYLDTGAQYRAMTWWMLRHGIDVSDARAVAAACDKPVIVSGTDPAGPTIAVDGEDVAKPIRRGRVTAAVSAVAGVQPVRDRLIALQRQIIADAVADGVGLVAEGRDIADVVYPAARPKIFLTASAEARASRRGAELGGADDDKDLDDDDLGLGLTDVLADLNRRDTEDAKTTRPHEPAPGAIVVDTTEMTQDQVIDHVVELVKAARG
jgi:CMP/dCMP kinase